MSTNITTHHILNTMSTNITSFLDGTASNRDQGLARVEIATLSLILIVAVGGNGFVLYALQRQKKRKQLSRVYRMMGHLSIADLLVGLFNILPQLAWDITFRFKGGPVLCKLVKFIQIFSLYLSTLMLVGMSLDRYFVIQAHHLKIDPFRFVSILVKVSYVLSAVMALPQVYIFSIVEISPDVSECWATWDHPWGIRAYVIWFVLTAFALPMCVMAVCYGYICKCLYTYSRKKDQQLAGGMDLSQAKIETLKMTLTVVICFAVCWTPFCVSQLYLAFEDKASVPSSVLPLVTICMLLPSLNSCTNPWIYLAFSSPLLNELRGLLGWNKDPLEDSSDADLKPPAIRVHYSRNPFRARKMAEMRAETTPQTKRTLLPQTKGSSTQRDGTPMNNIVYSHHYDGPFL